MSNFTRQRIPDRRSGMGKMSDVQVIVACLFPIRLFVASPVDRRMIVQSLL